MEEKLKDKFFKNPTNNFCFDCQAKNPDWVSVNNGIFLCSSCQQKHRMYGHNVSYVKSIEMDSFKEEHVKMISNSGNERLKELLKMYSIKDDVNRDVLYTSYLLDYYRKLLKSEIKNDPKPTPPNFEEPLQPFDSEKVRQILNNVYRTHDDINSIESDNKSKEEEFNILEDKENSKPTNGISSTLGSFAFGVWNTTVDVASNIKNKIDETGILEKAKEKTGKLVEDITVTSSYYTEKLKDNTGSLIESGKNLGYKGIELGKEKYEEVVSLIFNFQKTKGIKESTIETGKSIYNTTVSGIGSLTSYFFNSSNSNQNVHNESDKNLVDNNLDDIEVKEDKSKYNSLSKDF